MNLIRYWSSRVHEIIVLSGLLIGLIWVPIPLGSNRPFAWFGFELYVFTLSAFWAFGSVFYSEYRRFSRTDRHILFVLLAWLLFVLLQTVELPASLVKLLNPFVFSFQSDLGLISVSANNTLSMDPGGTFNEFLKYVSYIVVFYLLVSIVTTRQRLMWSMGILIAAGLAEAVFGIYCSATDFTIFPETDSAHELRSGTFVNRNHFSNLLSMVLGLVVGLMIATVNSLPQSKGRWRDRYSDADAAKLFLLVSSALVILAGILISGSRSPVVFFTAALLVMSLITYSGNATKSSEMIVVPLSILAVAVVIVVIGFDKNVVRLLDRDILGGEHLLQDIAGMKAFMHAWLTGVGAGNYRWIFTMFRGDELRFAVYDHAHNDYLELAIEQGVIGSSLLGAAVIMSVRRLYRGFTNRRNPWLRGVIFGCLLSVIYMLLQSLVEFNFRIPSNAIYFFAITALGLAACRIDRQQQRPRSKA